MASSYGERLEEERRKKMREFITNSSPEDLASLLDAADWVAAQFGRDYPTGIMADLVAAVSRVKYPAHEGG